MTGAAARRIALFVQSEYSAQITIAKGTNRPKSSTVRQSLVKKTPRTSTKKKPAAHKTSKPKSHRVDPYRKDSSRISITPQQRQRWMGFSPEKQAEYLKKHPDSVFHKLGVSKRKPKAKKEKSNKDPVSLHTRKMSRSEEVTAKRRIAQLQAKPEMLEPNSKFREEAAATIEHGGVADLKASLGPEQTAQAAQSVAVLMKKEDEKGETDSRHHRDDENFEEEDEELYGRRKRRAGFSDDDAYDSYHKKHKDAAYMAGGLILAAVLGIGFASLVNPSFAVLLGSLFLNKLPEVLDKLPKGDGESYHSRRHEDEDDFDERLKKHLEKLDKEKKRVREPLKIASPKKEVKAGDNDDATLQRFCNAVANFTRDEELPKDMVKKLAEIVP